VGLILKSAHFLMKVAGIPTRTQWRKGVLLRHIDRQGLGLEIGPCHRPIAPRREGFRVKILDCVDRAGLVEKYRGHDIDTSCLEEVDYVWKGESYPEIVGGTDVFDWIISSHTIEHVPDMVGFLKGCRDVLKVGGVLSLAVPDMRYTFDHRRAPSSLGAVIDAHLRGDAQPTPGAVAEFELQVAKRGGKSSWSRVSWAHYAASVLDNSPEEVRRRHEARMKDPEYVDVHVWTFTRDTFLAIFEALRALGILDGFEIIAKPISRCDEFLLALRRVA